jgi:elongation factor P
VHTEPAVKGDTVSGATKIAEVSTGYKLQVPVFLSNEEWIVIDTRTGAYVERVKR